MFCSYCGKQFETGKFCPYCGQPVAVPAPQAPQPPSPAQIQPEPVQVPVTGLEAPQPDPALQEPHAPPVQESDPAPAQEPLPYRPPVYPDPQPLYSDPQPAYAPPADSAPENVSPLVPSNPLLDAIRRLASSPLFLVAAILTSLAALLSMFASISSPVDISNALREFGRVLAEKGYDIDLSGLEQSIASSSGISSALTGMIPSLLTVLGVWLVYGAAKNRTKRMSTAGLTILKVLQVISLVVICIVTALIVLGSLAGVVFGAAYLSEEVYDIDEATIIAMVVAIIVASVLLVMVLSILCEAKLIKTINGMRKTLATGEVQGKTSMYVVVMLYIFAAFECSTGFSMLFSGKIVAGLSVLCTAAIIVLFAIVLVKYRKITSNSSANSNS